MKTFRILLIFLFLSSSLMAQEIFKDHLYSPDLIFKYKEKISLTDDQAKQIKEIYNSSVMSYNEFKWDLDAKMVALEELMSAPNVDVDVAEKKLEELLILENEIKRMRLATMLKIKNILTREQQDYLNEHKTESTKGYEIISSVNQDPRVIVKVNGKVADDGQPLYIIKNEYEEKVVSNLKAYDPNQIESIEVLKGEKATAVYGEKGKNGVIIIQLK